ncbi:MerR family transcriptional regulator [Geodermatophilus sp. DSM 44513]|uniref:DNA polymerase III subunit beta family protein n=1 Tax=Geodermatophilus sp. DSM 44513 TaxID=1528104 RepID=UPI001412B163|nr:MerR family transcriptional regulator [Geodermatophilus sp. DSM 44513]WNV77870.1 MerR family transcriptional regulator [Geodermatophilus sp. DSM 44513]
MARESGLSVSALRFYDGAGVLMPARVDPQSSYRFYGDDQVVTARLIARLRRVGLPLADIRRVLEHRREPSVVEEVLGAHLARLEDGLADARCELSAARALLDQEKSVTAFPAPVSIRTTAAELAAALRAVGHAVGKDPELPMLTGVLLDVDDAAVRLVATDRYRLAVSALAGAEPNGELRALLPVALVDEVLAACGDDGPTTICVEGDAITVEMPGRTVCGQRLDHDFPDYRRILRSSGAHRVDSEAAALRAQLAAAPILPVSTGPDGAEETATVLTLGSVEIGVNREFLLEALEVGAGGQLVLELDGPIAPLVLRDPARPGDVRMLMPIRLP